MNKKNKKVVDKTKEKVYNKTIKEREEHKMNFKTFAEAKAYAEEQRTLGFGAYVEEFYDFNGRFFSVITWEK